MAKKNLHYQSFFGRYGDILINKKPVFKLKFNNKSPDNNI